jgi:hypothetical protein
MKRQGLLSGAIASIVIAITVIGATPASAQDQYPDAGVKAGFLSCQVAQGWGFVFGSSRAVKCVYSPKAGVKEHYDGDISKFGVDIGYLSSGVMLWGVVAPTSDVGKGDLAGTYAGATAGGSLGVGADISALFGGFNESIALQPLSIEADNGLNLAAGVESLSLQPVAQRAEINTGEQPVGTASSN